MTTTIQPFGQLMMTNFALLTLLPDFHVITDYLLFAALKIMLETSCLIILTFPTCFRYNQLSEVFQSPARLLL